MDFRNQATQGIGLGSSVSGHPVSAQGAVADALNECDNAASNLLNELDSLEQRLSAVLRAQPPSGPTNQAEVARPPVSPLANGVYGVSLRLYRALEQMRSINARVDL